MDLVLRFSLESLQPDVLDWLYLSLDQFVHSGSPHLISSCFPCPSPVHSVYSMPSLPLVIFVYSIPPPSLFLIVFSPCPLSSLLVSSPCPHSSSVQFPLSSPFLVLPFQPFSNLIPVAVLSSYSLLVNEPSSSTVSTTGGDSVSVGIVGVELFSLNFSLHIHGN